MANARLEEIRRVRLDKLDKLKKLGINPYPSKYSQPLTSVSEAKSKIGTDLSVAGRVMHCREHGNVVFMDLQDSSGKIQILLQKKILTEQFPQVKLVDVGDFLGVTGTVISTKAGETTVDVSSFTLLSKSLRPLPDDWFGLKDEEARYRQRYLDLLLDQKLGNLLRLKGTFWNSMRRFLLDAGFIEVETPVLETTPGGADATPFVTHHEALDIDLYLRISMGELWQKRLMVAGFDKTFEIGRQFRNEGLSREHLQDYTQMEFYWGYADFTDSMKLVEKMYKHVIQETFGTLKFSIHGYEVDFSQPWGVIDYQTIVKEKLELDVLEATVEQLRLKLTGLHLPYTKGDSRGRLIDHLIKHIRKEISGPVFLTGHPVEVSPLAKRSTENPKKVERYQIIIAGSEMGNGYSELNDPVDQAERFAAQQELREKGDTEAQMFDHEFVTALEHGMPPVTGFGVSERLFSFLADKPIRETVLFPLLRPEK